LVPFGFALGKEFLRNTIKPSRKILKTKTNTKTKTKTKQKTKTVVYNPFDTFSSTNLENFDDSRTVKFNPSTFDVTEMYEFDTFDGE